jgi:hypothetical protein
MVAPMCLSPRDGQGQSHHVAGFLPKVVRDVLESPTSHGCRAAAAALGHQRDTPTTGGLFQLETIRFRLEHCRKPLLTCGRNCRRFRRHLPRMAQALPREWKQRVAANPQAAVPPKLEASLRACHCRQSMEGRNVTETTVQSADWQRRQYRTLLGLSKAIATHRNLSDLLHDLASHLRDLVDFRYLAVSLHDGSRRVMRVHIPETSEPAVRQFPSEIPIEGSIVGCPALTASERNQHDAP